MSTLPPVKLNLVGLDGNAFALIGAFRRAARKAGWPAEEITKVCEEATSGDYNHVIATLVKATTPEDEEDKEDEEDEEDED